MSDAAIDIRITDLDEEMTRQSDTASGLRHLYLELSANPPNNWKEIFEHLHANSFDLMKRRAWIEGNYIVIDCVPEEIAAHHLPALKQEVAQTNKLFSEHLTLSRTAILTGRFLACPDVCIPRSNIPKSDIVIWPWPDY